MKDTGRIKNIEKIREAVLAHHGGLADATDGQIMRLWNSLDEKTRRRYLQPAADKPVDVAEKIETTTAKRPAAMDTQARRTTKGVQKNADTPESE